MLFQWALGISVGALAIVVFGLAIRRFAAIRADARSAEARRTFLLRREWLEAQFWKLASESGMPRGLRWADCDFENPVAFARDLKHGTLTALVAITIRFEAIEGGGMEDVEAVGNLKAATAIFRHEHGSWTTEGRAIFNLNPEEAIAYYRGELEMVD